MKEIAAICLTSINLLMGLGAISVVLTCKSHRQARLIAVGVFEFMLFLGGLAAYWGMAINHASTIPGMIGVLIAFLVGHLFVLLVTASSDSTAWGAIGTRQRTRLGHSERKEIKKKKRQIELDRKIREIERDLNIP